MYMYNMTSLIIIKNNCLSTSESWEQREALEFLGDVMPLIPVPFDHMVHLITLCGTLSPRQHPEPQDDGKAAQKSFAGSDSKVRGIRL